MAMRSPNFAGLSRRAPVPSFCMLIFLLVSGGHSTVGGILRKVLSVFCGAEFHTGNTWSSLWLVVLAIAMSAVSLYYYLKVLKSIYVIDPPAGAAPIRISSLRQVDCGPDCAERGAAWLRTESIAAVAAGIAFTRYSLHQFIDEGLGDIGRAMRIVLFDQRAILQDRFRVVQ